MDKKTTFEKPKTQSIRGTPCLPKHISGDEVIKSFRRTESQEGNEGKKEIGASATERRKGRGQKEGRASTTDRREKEERKGGKGT